MSTQSRALVSLSHAVREGVKEIRIAAQRGGAHFDVIIGPGHFEPAQSSLVSFLKEVSRLHQGNATTPIQAADIFSQVEVSGTWFHETYTDGRPARMVLVLDGWSYADRAGVVIPYGACALEDA